MIATRLQSNVQCNQNQQIYSVYDSKSGKPIPKAKILLYKPNYPGYTLLDSLFTNSRGMAFSFRSLSKQNLAYQVINPENPNGPINPIYRQYTSPSRPNPYRLDHRQEDLPARADGLLQRYQLVNKSGYALCPGKPKIQNQL